MEYGHLQCLGVSITSLKRIGKKSRGHPGSNRGPLDLQSNALPLSYIPSDDMEAKM